MNKKLHALMCICVCMVLTACGNDTGTMSVPELLEPVMSAGDTVKVEVGDIDNTEILTAEIIPHTEKLSFDREGTVDTVFVNVGDRVKKGDKLAVLEGGIDNTELRDINNEIDAGKKNGELDNLELEYDIKILKLEGELLEDKVKKSSGKEKREAQKELDINKADIKIAEQNLMNRKEMQQIELAELQRKKELIEAEVEQYYIYSTIDGVVSYIMLDRGAMASKGFFAIAVSDYGNLYVRSAFVNNREFMSAQRCYITHNDNEYDVVMRPYDTAEVKKLLESGVSVYSYFDYKDPDVPLEMGTYVDLRIESGSSKNVMMLPINAVYTDSEKSYVYKNVDGRKVMTEIKKGIVNSAYVEIVSGLEEGDEVYVKP